MATNLQPVSSLVNVQINLASAPAQGQSLADLLILGTSPVIDVTERIRTYYTITAVAQDFGTTAGEYLAAAAFFGQSPQPKQLLIGRWAKTDLPAQLLGATLNTTLSAWTSITNGSAVYHDGTESVTLSGLDFSGATSLFGVANVIQVALQAAAVNTPDFVWNDTYSRFELTLDAAATVDVNFFTASGTGTDIASLGGLLVTDGGYLAPYTPAETALEAVVEFDDRAGQRWYALFIDGASDNDHLDVAAFIEASNTKHSYGVNTQAAGVLSSVSTTDIAYKLEQLAYKKTVVQYSSKSKYAVVSLLARILTTDYTANKTVIDLMYKVEPGVIAESLPASQLQTLKTKHCNVFINYDNDTAIIQPGDTTSGDPVDLIFAIDWFAIDTQNTLYNLLYSNPTKIPQTNEGHNILASGIASVCEQGVRNGFIAPGTWTQSGFGTLKQGDFLSKGYYVFFEDVSLQNPADRAARKSQTFQVALKAAGAIRTVDVIVNVNR